MDGPILVHILEIIIQNISDDNQYTSNRLNDSNTCLFFCIQNSQGMHLWIFCLGHADCRCVRERKIGFTGRACCNWRWTDTGPPTFLCSCWKREWCLATLVAHRDDTATHWWWKPWVCLQLKMDSDGERSYGVVPTMMNPTLEPSKYPDHCYVFGYCKPWIFRAHELFAFCRVQIFATWIFSDWTHIMHNIALEIAKHSFINT